MPRSDAATLVAELRAAMASIADPAKGDVQREYMKSELPYYGISSPDLRYILREPLSSNRLTTPEDWNAAILELWDTAGFREEWYAALSVLRHRYYRAWRLDMAVLPLVEHLIRKGAWWDVVDELAANVIGDLLREHPSELKPLLRRWADDDSLWIRRTAILAQLRFRADTDTALLTDVIEPNLGDREFFARKAIGWALREYAKVDPDWVCAFVADHADRISPLSRKEALKHLLARD